MSCSATSSHRLIVPYRAGQTTRKLTTADISRMVTEKVIEPGTTELATSIVSDPKKGGSLCFYDDYQEPNRVTIRDLYPLPLMDTCIDSLGEGAVFSTLDASFVYWRVELDKTDRDKTASTSPYGPYRFIRILLGLENGPCKLSENNGRATFLDTLASESSLPGQRSFFPMSFLDHIQ